MSKGTKKTKRPYWLSEKCPPWCGTRHATHDFLGDRNHHSDWSKYVTLSLMEPRWRNLGKEYGVVVSKPNLVVWLQQFVRETEPRVIVETETNEDSVGKLDLTLTEARKLGNALLRAAEVAEGKR